MTLDLSTLYAATGTAKLADLPAYELEVKTVVPRGADVTLTGPGPIWLYLRIAHALHGIARILTYDSPVTGPVVVFDHNPH
ncbi:MAG: CRISPR-associated protein Csx3 [Prosthecobacter sp.]|uniref:CRISPR-associated protein Csx3 n=1 Tax=Prosthecobacter sp. TaxID=1965333 RepID=UPI0025FF95E7|nr:CRISPR-associated protein Csx3 [Prosthecobacter sp.]MCF7786755.1 CRISPR-associated protein Csx3 [Prosthecobacter sp.]